MLRLATVLLLWAFVTILATPVQRLDHYEQTLFKPEDNMTAVNINSLIRFLRVPLLQFL